MTAMTVAPVPCSRFRTWPPRNPVAPVTATRLPKRSGSHDVVFTSIADSVIGFPFILNEVCARPGPGACLPRAELRYNPAAPHGRAIHGVFQRKYRYSFVARPWRSSLAETCAFQELERFALRLRGNFHGPAPAGNRVAALPLPRDPVWAAAGRDFGSVRELLPAAYGRRSLGHSSSGVLSRVGFRTERAAGVPDDACGRDSGADSPGGAPG